MRGVNCGVRNQLYKRLGSYAVCLLCQHGLPRCGLNLYQIATELMKGAVTPIANPTLNELLLESIRLNYRTGRCSPCCLMPCVGGIGLDSNADFISYYLGEYVYRLLYGLGDPCLDRKLCQIFNACRCGQRGDELNCLLIMALSPKKDQKKQLLSWNLTHY